MSWLEDLPQNVPRFLERMKGSKEGFRHYSLSGDYLPERAHWGLGNAVFALKIIHTLGSLTEREDEVRELREYILSFRSQNGYFHDPFVRWLSLPGRIARALLRLDPKALSYSSTRRAETRQAISALALTGDAPAIPQGEIPGTPTAVKAFLDGLDWRRPWHAGAHFSHLLFFLVHDGRERNAPLIEAALEFAEEKEQESGGWGEGELSLQQRINGAMKMITGMTLAGDVRCSHPRALIDRCLEATRDGHACDNFNVIYVLRHISSLQKRYRRPEVVSFAEQRLSLYRTYYYPRFGGFSFYQGKANRVYYDAPLTRGRDEPDIHGTLMFLWGLSVIGNVIKLPIKLEEHSP